MNVYETMQQALNFGTVGSVPASIKQWLIDNRNVKRSDRNVATLCSGVKPTTKAA